MAREADTAPVEMRSADLLLLLAGTDLAHTRRRRWYERVAYCTAIASRISCAWPEKIADFATARTVIADLQVALARAESENTLPRQKLDVLCHKLFGQKSEGVSPDQLRLDFAQLVEELKPRDDPTEMGTGERPGR